jgi:cell division protein YceG involved in septum cleavage
MYNDKISKFIVEFKQHVKKYKPGNSYSSSELDSDLDSCKKYRKTAWPDEGYICSDCYKLKRAENMVHIMNGLFRHFMMQHYQLNKQ